MNRVVEKPPIVKAAESIAMDNVLLRCFLLRLLDPEDLGHAVTEEVRKEALELVVSHRKTKQGYQE
jgi:hypothetical protein